MEGLEGGERRDCWGRFQFRCRERCRSATPPAVNGGAALSPSAAKLSRRTAWALKGPERLDGRQYRQLGGAEVGGGEGTLD